MKYFRATPKLAIDFKKTSKLLASSKEREVRSIASFFLDFSLFSLFQLTPFHQVLLWYRTAVSRRAIVYCRRLPVRPSGNNPQSLYSGLRELQVDSPSPHPNNSGWTKKGKQILGCTNIHPGKKTTPPSFRVAGQKWKRWLAPEGPQKKNNGLQWIGPEGDFTCW